MNGLFLELLERFSFSYAFGQAFCSLFVPIHALGDGLQRFLHLLSVVFMVTILAVTAFFLPDHTSLFAAHIPLGPYSLSWGLVGVLALVFFILPPLMIRMFRREWIAPLGQAGVWGQFFLVAVVGLALGQRGLNAELPFLQQVLSLTSHLSSALILYAMIMGHWYLIVPKLSESYLLRVIRPFFLLLGIKFVCLCIIGDEIYFLLKSLLFKGDLFEGVLFFMRFGWGTLGSIVCMMFAYKLTKMRSIQSATGVLYVAVCFNLVGDVIGHYLATYLQVFL